MFLFFITGKVVEKLPSPLEMSEEKVEKLMCNQACRFDSLPEETQTLKQGMIRLHGWKKLSCYILSNVSMVHKKA